MQDTIFAAGTVCWRATKKGGIKVLLIRRVKHKDWSFPKGKVDKGESLPAAAVRETYEETDLAVTLGTNLGTISYMVGKNQGKTVQYWAAKVARETALAHRFTPNDEVYKIKWIDVNKVGAKLTYPADRELFTVFEKLVADDSHDTFAVTLLRHAKAQPRSSDLQDNQRPLTDQGMKQAQVIVPTILAFGPESVISSTALRCLDTVAPLSEEAGLTVAAEEGISQDEWESGETGRLREVVAEVVESRVSTVLCSHSPVLPDLAREIASVTVSSPGRYLASAVELPTAAFSIFHVSRSNPDRGIVAVETYPIKV